MPRLTATLTLVLLAIASGPWSTSTTAGETISDKSVIAPQDPVVLDPGFRPGLEFSAFGAGGMSDSDSAGDALGGGVGLAYYFTKNVGVDLSYAVFAFDSEVHTVTADVALRYPLSNSMVAPYLLVGGGVSTDGSTEGLYRLGGGLDVRMPSGNLGVFADGIYNWVDGEANFTIARFGVRIPF